MREREKEKQGEGAVEDVAKTAQEEILFIMLVNEMSKDNVEWISHVGFTIPLKPSETLSKGRVKKEFPQSPLRGDAKRIETATNQFRTRKKLFSFSGVTQPRRRRHSLKHSCYFYGRFLKKVTGGMFNWKGLKGTLGHLSPNPKFFI
ncbi:hypothetical protein RUM43_002198 [Polyplax serrata]|uniref:Uncharacterized protein n=1 Tax=Polyplax serrata TaxID=468196 RepID=A0AAN8S959_POLSC